MSFKSTIMGFIFAAIMAGFYLMALKPKWFQELIQPDPSRHVSAPHQHNHSNKMQQLNPTEQPLIHTSKLQSPINIKITKNRDSKVQLDEPFELSAQVSSDLPLKQVEIQWVLPENIELVRGSLFQNIGEMKAEKLYEANITLKALNNIDSQIFVKVVSSTTQQTSPYNVYTQKEQLKQQEELAERAKKDIESVTQEKKVYK